MVQEQRRIYQDTDLPWTCLLEHCPHLSEFYISMGYKAAIQGGSPCTNTNSFKLDYCLQLTTQTKKKPYGEKCSGQMRQRVSRFYCQWNWCTADSGWKWNKEEPQHFFSFNTASNHQLDSWNGTTTPNTHQSWLWDGQRRLTSKVLTSTLLKICGRCSKVRFVAEKKPPKTFRLQGERLVKVELAKKASTNYSMCCTYSFDPGLISE